MKLRDIAKAGLAFCLTGGMLLTSACMLFVCPLVGSAPVAEEACHSAPGHDPEPVQCPYAVMQLAYAPPLLELQVGHDADRADVALLAAPAVPQAVEALADQGSGPPGDGDRALHVRLCVFRI